MVKNKCQKSCIYQNLFVNLHRCLKNLRKFDKQHIKSSLVFVLVDGGCLAAIFL